MLNNCLTYTVLFIIPYGQHNHSKSAPLLTLFELYTGMPFCEDDNVENDREVGILMSRKTPRKIFETKDQKTILIII